MTASLTRIVAAGAALLLAGCAAINRQIDHWALEQKAQKIMEQDVSWSPGVVLPFRSEEELERLTRPAGPPAVAIAPLSEGRRRGDFGLVQEELTFPCALPLRFPEANLARAYVYRQGRLGERPVILWVPGQNISDRDMPSLQEFFGRALKRGVDIVFYVPPYHLERTPAGFASGDAFLATDFSDHLRAFAQELSDLRQLVAWLRANGVGDLGAFGSSMGGAMVLRLVTWEPLFDFAITMQPLVDWNLLIAREEMRPVRRRLAEQGVSDEEVMLVYRAIDPRTGIPKISPARITVLYGRFDLIAAEGPLLALRRLWGLRRFAVYDRGHALITIGGRPYRDFGEALDLDLHALRWRRFLRHLPPAR